LLERIEHLRRKKVREYNNKQKALADKAIFEKDKWAKERADADKVAKEEAR
jgi:hypothetical protein